MSQFLMISSRDPFEFGDTLGFYQTCADLIEAGSNVTLLLVQNGVLPARQSKFSSVLEGLSQGGVKVLADSFALKARGINNEQLVKGVASAEIAVVTDHLASGSKVVWN